MATWGAPRTGSVAAGGGQGTSRNRPLSRVLAGAGRLVSAAQPQAARSIHSSAVPDASRDAIGSSLAGSAYQPTTE